MFKTGCALYYSMAKLGLVDVNKHNTARIASCWFIIYYIQMLGCYFNFSYRVIRNLIVRSYELEKRH